MMKSIARRLVNIGIISVLRLLTLFSYKGPFNKGEVQRILVYGYTGLGNFILFTPALKKLRGAFPRAHIILQAGLGWGAEEVVRGSGIVDEITWFRPDSGWFNLLKWIRKIRREKYDLIISSFDSSLPIQTCLSGARYRVGHVSGGGYRNPLDFVYNIRVPVREGRHEIDMKCDLLAVIGEEVTDRTTFFYIDKDSEESAKRLLAKHELTGKDYICLQPGAANTLPTAKRWGIENFAVLVDNIVNKIGIDAVILGDSSEKVMGDFFKERISSGERVHLLFGETTVKEAAAIVQHSRLLIGNDSGLMHVAVAVGTPLVAIYGPTDYARTAPRSEKATVVRHEMPCSPCIRFSGEGVALACTHHDCINTITVEEVFEAVAARLKEVK